MAKQKPKCCGTCARFETSDKTPTGRVRDGARGWCHFHLNLSNVDVPLPVKADSLKWVDLTGRTSYGEGTDCKHHKPRG